MALLETNGPQNDNKENEHKVLSKIGNKIKSGHGIFRNKLTQTNSRKTQFKWLYCKHLQKSEKITFSRTKIADDDDFYKWMLIDWYLVHMGRWG